MRHVENPPNPYLQYSTEYLGEPPPTKMEIFEDSAKTIITKAFSSEMGGARYTVNCYRGCHHGCTYCFARRYHELLGYGAGTDFETKIVVKPNAPELLRHELKKTRDKIPHLDFSFATDPYLPLEASYQLTRQCLEVCRDFQVPVCIITKSPLVTRDIDVLTRIKKLTVFFSIPFPTLEKSKPFELYTPRPEVRFEAMKVLAQAGISVGIAIAPIIMGYNEGDVPVLLKKAREAGATKAFISLVHIDSDSIEEYFVKNMREKIPTKADKIINFLKRERKGKLQHKNYEERNHGATEQWQTTVNLFEIYYKKYGFDAAVEKVEPLEERKAIPVQGKLF